MTSNNNKIKNARDMTFHNVLRIQQDAFFTIFKFKIVSFPLQSWSPDCQLKSRSRLRTMFLEKSLAINKAVRSI